jgi:IstB-like ATP binding protein
MERSDAGRSGLDVSGLLSPGRPLQGDPVSVVEKPVAERVGDGRLSELIVQVLDRDLAGEDGGAGAVAVFEEARDAEPRTVPAPPIDIDTTRERLVKLGLVHAGEQLATWLGEAVAEETPPHRFLDRLLEQELRARDERRVRTSLVLSALPTGQTLANFDFAFQPALERSRIETLATCQWIRENRTPLIQGPPGVDKTHLAVALGMRAVELGFGVVFYRLEDLLTALKRDADLPTRRLRSTGDQVGVACERRMKLKPPSEALFIGGWVRKTGCRLSAED